MRTVSPLWSFRWLSDFFAPRAGQDVFETELLKAFFPDEDLFAGGISLDLFEKHFLLYRRLFVLDDELRAATGQRLWIRGIRVTLLAAPPAQHCSWLDEATGRFCLAPTPTEPCPHHSGLQPAPNSLKAYYLDWTNLETMTGPRLHQLIENFFGWVEGWPEREAALQAFDLAPTASAAEIKRRWRDLSRQHHPDRGGDLAHYQRLSQAWSVLRRDLSPLDHDR